MRTDRRNLLDFFLEKIPSANFLFKAAERFLLFESDEQVKASYAEKLFSIGSDCISNFLSKPDEEFDAYNMKHLILREAGFEKYWKTRAAQDLLDKIVDFLETSKNQSVKEEIIQLIETVLNKLPQEVGSRVVYAYFKNFESLNDCIQGNFHLVWIFAKELAPLAQQIGEIFQVVITEDEDSEMSYIGPFITFRLFGNRFLPNIIQQFVPLISIALPSLIEQEEDDKNEDEGSFGDRKNFLLAKCLIEFFVESVKQHETIRKIAVENCVAYFTTLAHEKWKEFKDAWNSMPEAFLIIKNSMSASEWRDNVNSDLRRAVEKFFTRLPMFAVEGWKATQQQYTDVIIKFE